MKAFFLHSSLFSSVEAMRASSRLPSLIFSLLFLPSCPHSIHFHFPLSSLYSCFHFNPISQSSSTPILHLSQSSHQLSDKLSLTSSTCLSPSFLSFHPFFIFLLTAFFTDTLLLVYFLSLSRSFSADTRFPSVECTLFPSLALHS